MIPQPQVARRRLHAVLLPALLVGARVLRRFLVGRRPSSGGQASLDPATWRALLVVRPDGIGDVILTTGLLRNLHRAAPAAGITAAVHPAAAPLLETCPYVETVLPLDTHGIGHPRRFLRAFRYGMRNRNRRFDLAIYPRWGPDGFGGVYALCFSNARRRVAFSEHCSPEKALWNRGYDALLTDAVVDRDARHETERAAPLLEFLGCASDGAGPELWLTDADRAAAEALLAPLPPEARNRIVALAPGAGQAHRRWPVDRFAAIGQWLADACRCTPVVIGGAEDAPAAAGIRRAVHGRLLAAAGILSLRQSAALIARCRLLVSNDSAPVHLASAVGTPVVEISCHARSGSVRGPHSPPRFGPRGVPHTVLQPDRPLPPCLEECRAPTPHCITAVPVSAVRSAILAHLEP